MTAEDYDEKQLERLNFHLNTGDYFPMLAAILGFAQETVQDCKCSAEDETVMLETDVLKNARRDLMYLYKTVLS